MSQAGAGTRRGARWFALGFALTIGETNKTKKTENPRDVRFCIIFVIFYKMLMEIP